MRWHLSWATPTVADAESFKSGMRHLAAHVCLITTLAADGARRESHCQPPSCSVSADPPTLLCCVNRQIAPFVAIPRIGHLRSQCARCEGPSAGRALRRRNPGGCPFRYRRWIRNAILSTGAPVLEKRAGHLRLPPDAALEEVATHGILFGEIQAALQSRRRKAQPLLYAHGSFGAFAPLIYAIWDRCRAEVHLRSQLEPRERTAFPGSVPSGTCRN